jgi:hypothetical protein
MLHDKMVQKLFRHVACHLVFVNFKGVGFSREYRLKQEQSRITWFEWMFCCEKSISKGACEVASFNCGISKFNCN